MGGFINPEPLSISALILNLVLGVILSVCVAWFYARYGEALSNRVRFARLLPMLSLITILVISVIKASLALSLGLVGALSIVRFRTPIKDPEELLYLFLAIAIGLGLGADQRLPTVVAVGAIMVLLVVRRLLAPRARRHNLYLNIHAPAEGDGGANTFALLNDLLGQHVEQVDLRRLDRHDGVLQVTYLMDCKDQHVLTRLMSAINAAVPGCSYSFVDQQSLPEI